MADFLSSLPARTDSPPEWDMILAASQKNNADEVSRLLNEEGVPPSHCNIVGQTALHIAALWGSVETMEVLLTSGSNPNTQNRMKMTPLHCAIRGTFQSFRQTHNNRMKCLQLLLEAGANVEICDGKGKNAYESIDDAIMESKVRKMGDVEGEMEEMRAVLKKFCGSSASVLSSCIESMDLEGVRECLSNSNSDASGDGDGNEVVSQMEKNKGLLAVAGKFKSLVDENNTDKNTYGKLRDMIQCLLEADADPNSFLMHISTPAPMEGASLHTITSTICSMKITTTTSMENEILDIAADIVTNLRSHGAKLASVTMALLPNSAHRGKTRAVKFLLQSVGVDPNYRGRQGMTALILASRGGKIDVVRVLLEDDRLDLNITDDAGKKAIDYATANGKDDVVNLLLERS